MLFWVFIFVLFGLLLLFICCLGIYDIYDSSVDYIEELQFSSDCCFGDDQYELEKMCNRKKIMYKVVACISVIVAIISSFGLSLVVTASPHDKYKQWLWESEGSQISEIYSIKEKENISGSFALGFGSIKEESYYYYYVKTDNGFLLNDIIAHGTYIVEDDSVKPNISYKRKAWDYNVVYTITVPTNTIKVVYEL
jgi:hypothetical protein